MVNKLEKEDFSEPNDVLEFILDKKLVENQTRELQNFVTRSKKMIDKYYEDIKHTDRLEGMSKQEYFLSIKNSPKKIQKFYRLVYQINI